MQIIGLWQSVNLSMLSQQPGEARQNFVRLTSFSKAKASDSYIARLITGTKPDQPRFTIIGSGS